MPTKSFSKIIIIKTEGTNFILKSLSEAFDEAHFELPAEQKEKPVNQYVGDEKETIGFVAKIKRAITAHLTDVEHGGKTIELAKINNITIHPEANVILKRYIAYLNTIVRECGVSLEDAEKTHEVDNVFVLMRQIMIRLVTQALSINNEGTQDGDKLLVVLEKFIQRCGPASALKKSGLIFERLSHFQRALSSESHKTWMETLSFMVSQMKKLHLFSDTIEEILERFEEQELRILRFIFTILFPTAQAASLNENWIRSELAEKLQDFFEKNKVYLEAEQSLVAIDRPSHQLSVGNSEKILVCYKAKIAREYKGVELWEKKAGYLSLLFDIMKKLKSLQTVLSKLSTVNKILGCVPILLGIIDCDGLDKLIRAFDYEYRGLGERVFGPFKKLIPGNVDYQSALGGILKQEIVMPIVSKELPRFTALTETSHLIFLKEQICDSFEGLVKAQAQLQVMFNTQSCIVNAEAMNRMGSLQGDFNSLFISSRRFQEIEDKKAVRETKEIDVEHVLSAISRLYTKEKPGPLHQAAFRGDLELIKEHKNNHAVFLKDAVGNTLLHYAVCGKQVEVVRYCLREDKSMLREKNNYGETPFDLLISTREIQQTAIINLFLAEPGLLAEGCRAKGDTIFLWAVKNSHFNLMKWLFERDASVIFQKDFYGNNALHKAAAIGSLTMVEWLLDVAKIPVMDRDRLGRTPFFFALLKGHYQVARKFYEKNPAVLKAQDGNLNNALHFAVRSGNKEMISWVLMQGMQESSEIVGRISLHQHNNNGATPLDLAEFLELHSKDAAHTYKEIKELLQSFAALQPTLLQSTRASITS